MSRQLARDVVRSVAATSALAALVVGVPIGLAIGRGWPLPSSVPSLDTVTDALGGATISDAVLLDALACLSWLAWALLTWCAVVEVVAWARGRAATSVPGAGGLQLLVRRLVVSATLVVGAARTAGALPATPAAPVPMTLVAPSAIETVALTTPASVAETLPTCTVQPRDSLWRLAERHLGDPFRWREIFELNHGRAFSDGGVLRDADLIQPGWELTLPADAVGTTAPARAVAPSVTLDAVTTNAPTAASASDAPQPVVTAVPVPADVADEVADDEEDVDESVVPAGLGTATLVLAGAVTALVGLRRRQRRLRAPGRAIRLPGPAVLASERRVRAAADVDGAERVDVALRALAAQVEDAPPIEAVRVSGDEIEVLFIDVARGGDGPFQGVGTRAWSLPATCTTESLAPLAARGCVAPALVSIGRAAAGDVLIDLEAGGPLTVHGDERDVIGALVSLVLDLGTHRWADDVRVIAHGLDVGGLAALDRVEVAANLDAAVEDIAFESEATRGALARLGVSSTWRARLDDVGDGWTPTVLVLGPSTYEGDVDRALERLDGLPGVAVVVGSTAVAPIDRHRRLVVSPGRTHVALLPLDIVLEPAALPDDVQAAVESLISVAAAAEPGEALVRQDECDVIDLREAVDELPPERVIVRILGRVEIDGGRAPIDRRRVVEFVTLLALHPRGLTEGQIKTALWTQEPTTNAFNQVVSRARVALGLDSSGLPHVRYVEDCLYKPGRELVTDWSILERAWLCARQSPTAAALNRLQRSLDDVRGLPFEGTKGYEWAYELGLPSRIEAIIDEARLLLTSRDLVAG